MLVCGIENIGPITKKEKKNASGYFLADAEDLGRHLACLRKAYETCSCPFHNCVLLVSNNLFFCFLLAIQ